MALIIGSLNVQLFLEQRRPEPSPAPSSQGPAGERELRTGVLEQDQAELERQVEQRDADRLGGG